MSFWKRHVALVGLVVSRKSWLSAAKPTRDLSAPTLPLPRQEASCPQLRAPRCIMGSAAPRSPCWRLVTCTHSSSAEPTPTLPASPRPLPVSFHLAAGAACGVSPLTSCLFRSIPACGVALASRSAGKLCSATGLSRNLVSQTWRQTTGKSETFIVKT